MDSASTRTITVPLNSAEAFPTGTQIIVARYNTGEVSIGGTAGVTVVSANSFSYLNNQYSSATLIKRSTNSWYLFGDLKP